MPPDIVIRPAVISSQRDEEAYRRCIDGQERLYWPGWEETRLLSIRLGTRADVTIFVAAIDEPGLPLKIVGTLEVIGPLEASLPLPRRCLLRDVWVDEAYRRRGIGQSLVAAAEERVRAQGIAWLSLEVTGDNSAAWGLYKRAGYVEMEGDSPADHLMRPFNKWVRKLPGWMRGTITMAKRLTNEQS